MSPVFEPERKNPYEKTDQSDQEAEPAAPQAGMRQRLKGLGYEEGRALLSPDGSGGADPSGIGSEPAKAATPAIEATPGEPEGLGVAEKSDAFGPGPAAALDSGGVAMTDPGGVSTIPPESRRMVRFGSTGKEVVYAQDRLNAHGSDPDLATDGIFGPLTRKACLDFQKSHALSADAVIGPKSWASLDGPPQVGTTAGGGTSGGSGGPGGTMQYDNTAYPIAAPPVGTKRDVPIGDINTHQKANPPDLGPTIKVEDAVTGTITTNSDLEVHLYWVIAQLGMRARWGSEVDLVVQVGFPPKGSTVGVQGRVQLRIDGAGNATASFLGGGPAVVAATYSDPAVAITAMKNTWHLKDIVAGDKPFSVDDLNKVNAAFQRLSSGEAAALNGIVLKRVTAIVEKGKPAAGLYSNSNQLSADGKTATSEAVISLADSAFAHDLVNFIGGKGDAAPISFQLILHEVGHAVESAERYKARAAEYEAAADVNRKVAVYNTENTAAEGARNDVNTALNAVVPTVNGYKGKVAQEAAPYVNSMSPASGRTGDYSRTKTSDDNAAAEAAATKAIQDRDTQKAALAAKSAAHPALTDLKDLSSKQDALFAQSKKRAAALKDWDDAKAVDKTAKGAVKATEDGTSTKRLKRFKDFVTTENIKELTEYAKTDTAEYYAEAFSLYRADPDYMQTAAPKLKAWFDKGEHLK